MVFHVIGDKDIEKSIDSWLLQSAQYGSFPSPLHSKPDASAIDACDELYDLVINEFGDDELHNLYHLNTDPYYDLRIRERNEWEYSHKPVGIKIQFIVVEICRIVTSFL